MWGLRERLQCGAACISVAAFFDWLPAFIQFLGAGALDVEQHLDNGPFVCPRLSSLGQDFVLSKAGEAYDAQARGSDESLHAMVHSDER